MSEETNPTYDDGFSDGYDEGYEAGLEDSLEELTLQTRELLDGAISDLVGRAKHPGYLLELYRRSPGVTDNMMYDLFNAAQLRGGLDPAVKELFRGAFQYLQDELGGRPQKASPMHMVTNPGWRNP
jgi:hypothetical protein